MITAHTVEQQDQIKRRSRKRVPAKKKLNDSENPFIIYERSYKCHQGRCYLVKGDLRSRSGLLMGYKATVQGGRHNGRNVALKKDINESSILLDLHHPNIIEFLGPINQNGFRHMVLDFYENSTLEEMIQTRRYLTAPEAREFGIKIAGGIRYLHNTAGIMLRDLGVENVLLDSNMNIKITGFKHAVRLESFADRAFDLPSANPYMAPEMRGGCGHDKSVDIWSLGIILMRMLYSSSGEQRSDHSVGASGKELIEWILVQASDRPDLDEIVMHSFFAGSYLSKMDASIRRKPPILPSHGFQQNALLYQQHCETAGVGRNSDGQILPCVGTKDCINPLRSEKEGVMVVDLGFEWD